MFWAVYPCLAVSHVWYTSKGIEIEFEKKTKLVRFFFFKWISFEIASSWLADRDVNDFQRITTTFLLSNRLFCSPQCSHVAINAPTFNQVVLDQVEIKATTEKRKYTKILKKKQDKLPITNILVYAIESDITASIPTQIRLLLKGLIFFNLLNTVR